MKKSCAFTFQNVVLFKNCFFDDMAFFLQCAL